MKKNNCLKNSFFTGVIFFLSFFIFFSSTDCDAQKNGNEENRKVELKEGAKKNGYKVTARGTALYIDLTNIIDPVTKKKYNGPAELQYRCKEPDPLLILLINVTIGNGNGNKLLCPELEPAPGQTLVLMKTDLILLK